MEVSYYSTRDDDTRDFYGLNGAHIPEAELASAKTILYGDAVGRCRLTVSKPVLTAPMVSALETIIS